MDVTPLEVLALVSPETVAVQVGDLDPEPRVVEQRQGRRFVGPLASLKRFAHEHSGPGLRFYVRERPVAEGGGIRIEVREAGRRRHATFESEAQVRRYISAEACTRPGIGV